MKRYPNNEHPQELQQESNIKEENDQGGFVAVLHRLEEQFYGPDSPLDAKGKIMLYIRHRALRDWTDRKQIGKQEIAEATGLKLSAIKDALRSLEKENHLLVTRMKVGKVWSDNIYELHPDRYSDYIYRPEKPSFRLIYGSKGHPSNSGPRANPTPTPRSENTPTLGVKNTLGNASNHSTSLMNSRSKNPLKEPYKELFPGKVDWIKGEMSEEDIEKRRLVLREQARKLKQEALENS